MPKPTGRRKEEVSFKNIKKLAKRTKLTSEPAVAVAEPNAEPYRKKKRRGKF
jgi:hypothetical protein